jgi:hypothetical protein
LGYSKVKYLKIKQLAQKRLAFTAWLLRGRLDFLVLFYQEKRTKKMKKAHSDWRSAFCSGVKDYYKTAFP